MRALLAIFLFGIMSNLCYAQPKTSILDVRNVYDEKGDYYFDKSDYKKAIVYYNMAYKKDAANYYSVLRKAEAFSALELLDQAAECYRIVFETSLYIPNEYRLQFALLLLKNKDVSGFELWLGKYNEIVTSEIKGYVSSTDVRAKMYKDSSFVMVENESVLNTPESETAPGIFQNKITFSSTRKDLYGSSANDNYNLFSATFLKEGRLGRLNNLNTSLNTTQNELSVLISNKTNKLFLTRGTSNTSNLKTFVSDIPKDAATKLEFSELNIEGLTSIGYPALNSDGTKMYFVSDAPGGIGGLDIYTSEWLNGKWSAPKNLGSQVNSSKDELYPYVLNDTMLYFTSAGHNGLGGLDLFVVNLKQENSSPKNLGSKVNSAYNDYSLSFSPEGYTGYFCSNRPGGMGKEDIYRLHLLDLKVKHAAYKFKKKSTIEEGKINLYLSDGEEHNIASVAQSGFNFGFQPTEPYKIVIQHENALASNIIYNPLFSAEQKKKEILNPEPLDKTEIKLQPGMRYQFTAGMKPLSSEYKDALNDLAKEYQSSNSSVIDLTALAKELMMNVGEMYTIRFVKDEDNPAVAVKDPSLLFINENNIPVAGRSFFFVLPLDIEANFNIQTDIAYFKENFNPKKTGAVKVDAEPVFKEVPVKESQGFPILVNTESLTEVSAKKIMATELTIIPGTMYILTLSKKDPTTGKDMEIVVPLTKGVKYNLGTETQSESEYNKTLSQMSAAPSNTADAELIDISILSKELNVSSDEDIVFSLMPAIKLASQAAESKNVLTTLNVDGRKFFVTSMQKLQVNLKLDQNKKVNIQTDLAYIKENFDASTIALKVDTSSFNTNLKKYDPTVITDPVFDVIVVNFDLNDFAIRPDAKVILENKVIQALRSDSRLYVTIKGYTDALGDAAYNEKLSKNRAEAVKDFLSKNGIGESRIRTFSYGASLALQEGVKWEDLSEAELQKHRKVEIIIYLPKK